jgi:hypothetical protein
MSASSAGELLWEISSDEPPTHRFSTRWFQDADSAGPVFEVGRSEPSEDWPRIHPGPLNAHTGYRELTATVRFGASGTAGRWHVLVMNAREASGPPPDLRIEVNGHRGLVVPAAVRDGRCHAPWPPSPVAGIIHRELWIPPGAVIDGANHLMITTIAAGPFGAGAELGPQQRPDLKSWFGSTLQWLDLMLRQAPAGSEAPPPTVTAQMTPLYQLRPEGDVEEIVDVVVRGLGSRSATQVGIELAGVHARHDAGDTSYDFGDLRVRFGVPETTGVQTARVRVSSPHGDHETEHSCQPARKWTVHLVPHVHLDIGYTDAQAKVIELHSRNLDKALKILDQTPDWRFAIDGSFIVQRFLRSRDEQRSEHLIATLRSGRLSVNAMWALLLSGVASLEDLYRAMYFSASLQREHGVPVTYANLTDVPSYPASMPSILSAAGIDAFMGISNHTRGGNADSDALHLLSPVRWHGPDGAQVLAFFADCYSQLRFVCADPPSIAGMAQGITRFLHRYERPDYLPDHLPLVGTHADNEDVSHGYARVVEQWNAAYEWPRLRFSTFADYLDAVRPLRDRLPQLTGDGGSYWEDGVGTQAAATATVRTAQTLLPAAEAVSALVTAYDGGLRPDIAALDEAWECVLIGSEHTWTWAHATEHPHAGQVADQLDWKVSRIKRGLQIAVDETRRALSQLAEQIGNARVPSILVVNPTSWARPATIEVDLAADRIVVDETGAPVPADPRLEADGRQVTRLRVPPLPPFGYCMYPIVAAAQPAVPTGLVPVPVHFETSRYLITVDEASGAVTGLWHKAAGWQMLDRSRGWALGDVLYACGGGTAAGRGLGHEVSSIYDYDPELPPADISVEVAQLSGAVLRRTPWGHVVERTGCGPTMPAIRQQIEFFDDADRVEVTVEIHKQPTLAKESVYIAFPFDIPDPVMRYDRQLGWVTPSADHQIGACNEWLTVQNAVVVGNSARSVEWTSADAPLFTMSDVVRGTWARRFVDRDTTILSWVMNNYWMTNTPAEQGGNVRLRYAFRSAEGFAPTSAGRLGRELRSPFLVSDLLNVDRCDDEPRPRVTAASLWPVNVPDNVVVTVLAGRAGPHITVRLQEIAGHAAQVRVPHPNPRATAWAAVATATETGQKRLPLNADGSAAVNLGPWEVLTLCCGS